LIIVKNSADIGTEKIGRKRAIYVTPVLATDIIASRDINIFVNPLKKKCGHKIPI
jgi:hypothetical protein